MDGEWSGESDELCLCLGPLRVGCGPGSVSYYGCGPGCGSGYGVDGAKVTIGGAAGCDDIGCTMRSVLRSKVGNWHMSE